MTESGNVVGHHPVNQGAQSPASNDGNQGGGKRRRSTSTISSLDGLVAAAYAKPGRAIKLSKSAERAIGQGPAITPELRLALLGAAAADEDLAVPPELLLATRRLRQWPQVRNALREFVGSVLRAHPIFSSNPDLLSALANNPDGPRPDMALRNAVVSARKFVGGGASPVTKSNSRRLARNAVHSLALWMAETRDVPVETVASWMNDSLWTDPRKRPTGDDLQLRALVGKPNDALLGLIMGLSRAQVDGLRSEVLAVQQKLQATGSRLESIAQELSVSRDEAAQKDKHVRELEAASQRQVETHRIELTHLRDDIERLRGRVVSRLRVDIGLLDDGIQALRATPPKIPVMHDYADRVIEGMRRQLTDLERGT